MTEHYNDLLYLFSCGARGLTPRIDHKITISKLYETAVFQGVWQIVFTALSKIKDSEFINWDIDFETLKLYVFKSAIENERKLHNTHNFIKMLNDNKIKATVLKGETLSKLYSEPELRISSDSDILIDKRLEKKACSLAKKFGLEVVTRGYTSHHAVVKGENTGIIELHINLYDEMLEDLWFSNKMENREETIKIKTSDGFHIDTLGITDGAIFVSLHLIKHFLEKGVGIRQMMDTLLYLKEYKNEIDYNRYFALLKELKYDKFIFNIIGIGIEYFKFSNEDFYSVSYDKALCDKILDDAFLGGVFGKMGTGGADFYQIYTQKRVENSGKTDYDKYMKKVMTKNKIKLLFPNQALLSVKYPYVKKSKLLVPIAWINRFINKILKKETDEKTVDDKIVRAAEKRLSMIDDLEMI